jgi:hypothetical protein
MSKKILFLGMPAWDGVWTRQNHFALRFSKKGYNVVYHEHQDSIYSKIKKNKFNFLFKKVRVDSLKIISFIPPFFGFGYKKFLLILNSIFSGIQLFFYLMFNNSYPDIVVIRLPYFIYIYKFFFSKSKLVYDVVDDYSFYSRSKSQKKFTNNLHDYTIKNSSLVNIVSEKFYEEIDLDSGNYSNIPNGVETSFFESSNDDCIKDKICFIGYLSPWLNYSLIEEIANKYKKNFVIIGPVNEDIKNKIQNILSIVDYRGFVKQSDLKEHIRDIQVFVMPYSFSDKLSKRSPLKLYEYLSTGVPVVSIDYSFLKNYDNIIYLSKNDSKFLENIELALLENSQNKKTKRTTVAKNFSWDILFEKYENKIKILR